ncbi:predicted protein [Histoplasma capsulatum var. duboisii H88]|uniref:Predicted protein n=1 Tax=Ajellomyces capsulatus (strain H88) TaxID=544711 RepID=F0UB75_AJEC8|nr:predicted protein [Histoplasma capsulatum var. duboisii H88]
MHQEKVRDQLPDAENSITTTVLRSIRFMGRGSGTGACSNNARAGRLVRGKPTSRKMGFLHWSHSRFWVLPSASGFGGDQIIQSSPMALDTDHACGNTRKAPPL